MTEIFKVMHIYPKLREDQSSFSTIVQDLTELRAPDPGTVLVSKQHGDQWIVGGYSFIPVALIEKNMSRVGLTPAENGRQLEEGRF